MSDWKEFQSLTMTDTKEWTCAKCFNSYKSFNKEKSDGMLKFNCPNCGHTVRRYDIMGAN